MKEIANEALEELAGGAGAGRDRCFVGCCRGGCDLPCGHFDLRGSADSGEGMLVCLSELS